MNKFRKVKYLAGKLVAISGWRVMTICGLGIVVGICLGIAEIIVGLSLEKFLSAYGLVERNVTDTDWFPEGLSALTVVVLAAVLQTVLRYFAFFIPDYALNLFLLRVRALVTSETLRERGDVSELSVAVVGNMMLNMSRDTANLNRGISSFLLGMVRVLILLAGIFVLSTELSLIAIGTIAIFGTPTVILRRYYVRYSNRAYLANASFTQSLLRCVRNVMLLKLSGRVASERDSLLNHSNRLFRNITQFNLIYFGNMVWPNLLSICIGVLIVVINYEKEFVSTVTLVPFVYLLTRIAVGISELSQHYGTVQLSFPGFSSMISYNEILLQEKEFVTEQDNVDIGAPKSVEIKALSVGRDTEILSNLNLKLNRGDMLLVSGESGIGKTTLLYTLMGLLRPIKGQILWNDVEIENVDQKSFGTYIAYSGSDPFLFDGTIEENIRLGQGSAHRADGEMTQALDLAACGFLEEFEGGLSHELKEGGVGISEGQKQRLSLARALLRKPSVLLLDEATSNVDTETEKRIFKNILEAFPDMIVISVSHRDTTAEFATNFLRFKGTTIETGANEPDTSSEDP